ncbi:hypothetical protein C8R47DRAFT_1319862 [Mycena vitilis]|nr:hypothetical protein C8R47DRAFT_1319862 [Mycena vitilis]
MQDSFLPLSSLSTLSLKASGAADDRWPAEIFKLLALSSAQEFLPSLRRLAVHQVNKVVSSDDYQMLLTALSVRAPRFYALKLSLGANDRGPSPEIVASLRVFVAKGMNIRIMIAGREKNLV